MGCPLGWRTFLSTSCFHIFVDWSVAGCVTSHITMATAAPRQNWGMRLLNLSWPKHASNNNNHRVYHNQQRVCFFIQTTSPKYTPLDFSIFNYPISRTLSKYSSWVYKSITLLSGTLFTNQHIFWRFFIYPTFSNYHIPSNWSTHMFSKRMQYILLQGTANVTTLPVGRGSRCNGDRVGSSQKALCLHLQYNCVTKRHPYSKVCLLTPKKQRFMVHFYVLLLCRHCSYTLYLEQCNMVETL